MRFYGLTETHVPKPLLAWLVLCVEQEELGITAGLQDRVIQVCVLICACMCACVFVVCVFGLALTHVPKLVLRGLALLLACRIALFRCVCVNMCMYVCACVFVFCACLDAL